jgi:hypothetical protein
MPLAKGLSARRSTIQTTKALAGEAEEISINLVYKSGVIGYDPADF